MGQGPDEEAELKEEPQIEFSGEEGMGRYLDLHPFYLQFINSKFGRQTDYAEYMGSATNFADISRSQRLGKAYRWDPRALRRESHGTMTCLP